MIIRPNASGKARRYDLFTFNDDNGEGNRYVNVTSQINPAQVRTEPVIYEARANDAGSPTAEFGIRTYFLMHKDVLDSEGEIIGQEPDPITAGSWLRMGAFFGLEQVPDRSGPEDVPTNEASARLWLIGAPIDEALGGAMLLPELTDFWDYTTLCWDNQPDPDAFYDSYSFGLDMSGQAFGSNTVVISPHDIPEQFDIYGMILMANTGYCSVVNAQHWPTILIYRT